MGGPNLETCTFGVQNLHVLGSKRGNLHVLGGPNLETCTFPGSKPGNLHVWGVQTWKPALKEKFWGVKTYQKGPEHEGFGVFRAFGFSGIEPNRTENAQNR